MLGVSRLSFCRCNSASLGAVCVGLEAKNQEPGYRIARIPRPAGKCRRSLGTQFRTAVGSKAVIQGVRFFLPYKLLGAILLQSRVLRGSCTRMAPNNLRSEEHTSELQSLRHLVCRLLLEKKNIAVWSHLLL